MSVCFSNSSAIIVMDYLRCCIPGLGKKNKKGSTPKPDKNSANGDAPKPTDADADVEKGNVHESEVPPVLPTLDHTTTADESASEDLGAKTTTPESAINGEESVPVLVPEPEAKPQDTQEQGNNLSTIEEESAGAVKAESTDPPEAQNGNLNDEHLDDIEGQIEGGKEVAEEQI